LIKRLSSTLYQYLISRFHKIHYSFLPNFINGDRVSYITLPKCEQKVIITREGKVTIGKKCSFGYKLGGRNKYGVIEFQARADNANIIIGDNIATNNNVFICSHNRITIGDRTLIGENVTIMDFEAHGLLPDHRRKVGAIGEVIIGQNVWIGNNVTILKDTNIGENTIIAAGAVVSGSFPSNVIIGGIPAKIIKPI